MSVPHSDENVSERLTFRAILPLFRGRTITGYATGAEGDDLCGLTLTFDDGTWAQITLNARSRMTVNLYAGDGSRIYADGWTGERRIVPPGTMMGDEIEVRS